MCVVLAPLSVPHVSSWRLLDLVFFEAGRGRGTDAALLLMERVGNLDWRTRVFYWLGARLEYCRAFNLRVVRWACPRGYTPYQIAHKHNVLRLFRYGFPL